MDCEDQFVAMVPAGISCKAELLACLYERLHLPGYFGFNWDALADCLCDFGWIEERRIILVHQDITRMPPTEIRTYLSILSSAIREWSDDDVHAFRVEFPEDCRHDIELLLRC